MYGFCPDCGLPHHLGCWNDYRGCANLECKSSPISRPSGFSYPLLEKITQITMSEEIDQAWIDILTLLKGENDINLINYWHKNKTILEMRDIPPAVDNLLKLAEQRLRILQGLIEAINSDQDERIAAVVASNAYLAEYIHAQCYLPRIRKAVARVQARDELLAAITSGDEKSVSQVWAKVNASIQGLPEGNVLQVQAAPFISRWETLQHFLEVVSRGVTNEIVTEFLRDRQTLLTCMNFESGTRQVVERLVEKTCDKTSHTLKRALSEKDDDALADLWVTHGELMRFAGLLSPELEPLFESAVIRSKALAGFRQLQVDKQSKLLEFFETNQQALEASRHFTWEDRLLIISLRRELARDNLKRAIANHSVDAIVDVAEKAISLGCSLSSTDLKAVIEARQLQAGIQQLMDADQRGDEQAMHEAWTSIRFIENGRVSGGLRDRVILVEQRMATILTLRRALRRADLDKICALYNPETWKGTRLLSHSEVDRANRYIEQRVAITALQEAMDKGDEVIAEAYENCKTRVQDLLSPVMRSCAEKACWIISRRNIAFDARDRQDPDQILKVYHEAVQTGVSIDDVIPPALLAWAQAQVLAQQEAVDLLSLPAEEQALRLGAIEVIFPSVMTMEMKSSLERLRIQIGTSYRKQAF